MYDDNHVWPPIETPEKLLREIGPVGTPAPDRTAELAAALSRVTAERDAAKNNAALLRAEVARLRAVVRDLSAKPEVSRG